MVFPTSSMPPRSDTSTSLHIDKGEPDTTPQIIFVAVGKYNKELHKLSLCHWSEVESLHRNLITRSLPVERTWMGKLCGELIIQESVKGFMRPPPKGYKVHTLQNYVLPCILRDIDAHLPLAGRTLVVYVEPTKLEELWTFFADRYLVTLHLYNYPRGEMMRSPTRIRITDYHLVDHTRNVDISNNRLAIRLRAKHN